jgi:Transmembrane protein of unknown function (DUF3556)
MGFLAPKLPRRFDVQLWHLNPRMERIKPLVRHWAENGFGTPWSAYLVYLAKIAAYLGGAILFIQSTPGIGPLSDIAHWWTEPVVFQKAVVWTLLFEVLGFGCGFGPLTLRFLPPVGGPLYWLRPGTIRLPPWPDAVPLTRGTYRTPVDALLYLALLAAAIWPLLSPVTAVEVGLFNHVHVLDPMRLIPLAVLVPLVGLRDKTIFLAARAEHTWIALLTLLLPFVDMVVAVKVLMVLIWWGAAASKLNRLFPFAVSVMLSNSPALPKAVKRRLYRRFPADMRPSALAKAIAHTGTTVEFVAPLVLLVSTNRWLTLAAVLTMVLFHLHILAALPLGVPLEWNVFMLFSLAYLFWADFPYQPATVAHPWTLAALVIPVIALVVWGNMRPDKVSFLLAMRYYAGNWATSMWALQPSAIEKIDKHVVKYGGFAKSQLRRLYGEHLAEVMAHKVYTFRAMHHHGRGLFALLPLAAGAEDDEQFVLEGELVAGSLLGWNFGEGHLHNEQLIAALQERCGFEPGEVRVVLLEARPAGSDRQEYRLVDAATGEFDRGFLLVSDLVSRQPWEVSDLPVYSSNPLGPPSPADDAESEDSQVDAA